jgi:penicillin amidase
MSNNPDKFQSRFESGQHANFNSHCTGRERNPIGTPSGLTDANQLNAAAKPFFTKRTYYVHENKSPENTGAVSGRLVESNRLAHEEGCAEHYLHRNRTPNTPDWVCCPSSQFLVISSSQFISATRVSRSGPSLRMGTSSWTTQKEPHRTRRLFLRLLIYAIVLALLVAAGAAGYGYWRIRHSLPQLDGTIQVTGLASRVEVRRDARGVPHLRALSLQDLLFAQGYVTAQDRLWQMDLSRRLAFGELSEIFGERTLRLDIENRTLGLRQVAERAVVEMDPESQKLLAAYTQGVNAFISTHMDRLPVEFLLLRYQPRLWQPIDTFGVAINMAKYLNLSWPDKLMREHIRSKVSEDLYADLFPDHSPYDHPVAEPVPAPPKALDLTHAEPLPKPQELNPVLASLLGEAGSSPTGLGSNNWVVSGAHTQSGKPLLANDPHLGHSIPSVWYMNHLKAPGLDVSGVTFPGLPLVVIGHNERIAWGMTNTGPDVQDLYEESFNLREPGKYLHNGEWVSASTRNEVIKVHNGVDYGFRVMITRHGPVISHDGHRDLALRWTELEPHAIRFPFLRIDRAQNWAEFTNALCDFTGPMQNFVYADADGNIGYYAAAWVPIRAKDDGTTPTVGSTDDYDWTGYIPFESLPHAYNPVSGIIATANGRVVPDNYPYFITHHWDPGYRTARIVQLLQAKKQFDVEDMLRIQTDIHALQDGWLAKQLLRAAQSNPPSSADVQYALTLLGAWDGEAHADSGATLVCEVTRQALLKRILKPKLGDDLSGYSWSMSSIFLQNVLTNHWTRWLPPGDADFNVTLIESLQEGVASIPALVGSTDRTAWQWGKTIPLTFTHRLSSGLGILGRFMNVGPVPQAGTGTTVKQTTPTVGPSMRMVVDFSNFDQSVQNITLGESGQVFSPYYKDQFESWYTGSSFPMLFSDREVEKGTVHQLILEPTGRQ